MASIYCEAYTRIEVELRRERQKCTPQEINGRIRREKSYDGPGGSWLSDAKRLQSLFPEVFRPGTKNLPYGFYRLIAICALPVEKKAALKKWAEKEKPTRACLLERINQEKVGIVPDFDLKVTNCWRFSRKYEPSAFDGGIHPDLVANLLHYYSTPGAAVLDPMAGGRTTWRVLNHFEYFRQANPALPNSGPRSLVECDISPTHDDVIAADVRTLADQLQGRAFDFILLDPPYWKVAKGKYDHFGETVEEWSENVGKALAALARLMKPNARLAVVVDDYLRSEERKPLALYVAKEADAAGLAACETIYNPFPNAVVSMGPAEMDRAKKARMLVNGCKIIQIFQLSR